MRVLGVSNAIAKDQGWSRVAGLRESSWVDVQCPWQWPDGWRRPGKCDHHHGRGHGCQCRLLQQFVSTCLSCMTSPRIVQQFAFLPFFQQPPSCPSLLSSDASHPHVLSSLPSISREKALILHSWVPSQAHVPNLSRPRRRTGS